MLNYLRSDSPTKDTANMPAITPIPGFTAHAAHITANAIPPAIKCRTDIVYHKANSGESSQMSDLNVFQEHGGKITLGIASVFVAVFKWLVGREVSRIDSKFDDHGKRLHALELQVATKDDLREIRETMTAQHGQLLDAVMGKKE